MRTCTQCGRTLQKRHQIKYCSNKCQQDYQYALYIEAWKSGLKDGNIGISARNISGHIKRYLIRKYGARCSLCKWNKRHPTHGHVPIEIDHIDGNAENNTETNLRLVCQNCHALTDSFKNFNKGRGRLWRKDKYIRNEQI